jgi:hypothetical protein
MRRLGNRMGSLIPMQREVVRRLKNSLAHRVPLQRLDFDDLSRALARGLPRRDVLRLLGGGVVGWMLASVGLEQVWLPRKASGQGGSGTPCDSKKAAVCQHDVDHGFLEQTAACSIFAALGVIGLGAATGVGLIFAGGLVVAGTIECEHYVYHKSEEDRANCARSIPGSFFCTDDTSCVNNLCCPAGWVGCGQACLPSAACCNGQPCTNSQPQCPSGQTPCSGQCVPVGTDQNCSGQCDACPAGQHCVNGRCTGGGGGCPSGQVSCNGVCTALGTNQNCSRCGAACASGQQCINGQCIGGGECPSGQVLCNGVCTPLGTDRNCSRCGDDCSEEGGCGICVNRQCVPMKCGEKSGTEKVGVEAQSYLDLGRGAYPISYASGGTASPLLEARWPQGELGHFIGSDLRPDLIPPTLRSGLDA